MAPPQLGTIMTLSKEAGVDKKTAKAALIEHSNDYDAALAQLTKDSKDSAGETGAEQTALSLEEEEQAFHNTSVSVIRMEVGDGVTFPAYGDTLSMEYTGKLEDGEVFDSTYAPARGEHVPFSFRIGMGKVIKGWDEGIMKMSLGEKALLIIPSAKAYGSRGHGPIPPNADLKFEVRLLKITRQTSCLGAGKHGGVQRQTHEYANVAAQLLGQAPRTDLDLRPPDDRKLMPLTSDMPA